MCLFLFHHRAAFTTMTLKYSLESGVAMPHTGIVLSKMNLTLLGLLCFTENFENFFSVSENCPWDLDWNCLSL